MHTYLIKFDHGRTVYVEQLGHLTNLVDWGFVYVTKRVISTYTSGIGFSGDILGEHILTHLEGSAYKYYDNELL